jgi:hypothetical protein
MERDAPDELMQQHAGIAVQRAQRSQTTPAGAYNGPIRLHRCLRVSGSSLSPLPPPPVRACVCMCLAQNRSTIGETARSKKRRERSRTRSSSSSNAIRDSWDSEFRIQNSESELSRIALSIAANAATGEGDGSGGERGKREKEIARIPVRSDTRALPFEPSRVPLLSSPNYHSRSSCVGARTSDSSFLPLSLSLSLV